MSETNLRHKILAIVEEECAERAQLKLHLHRLEELEYLLLHRGGRGQSFVYELLYDGTGKGGQPFLCGLIEVDKLRESQHYDANRSGLKAEWSGLAANLSASSRAPATRLIESTK